MIIFCTFWDTSPCSIPSTINLFFVSNLIYSHIKWRNSAECGRGFFSILKWFQLSVCYAKLPKNSFWISFYYSFYTDVCATHLFFHVQIMESLRAVLCSCWIHCTEYVVLIMKFSFQTQRCYTMLGLQPDDCPTS